MGGSSSKVSRTLPKSSSGLKPSSLRPVPPLPTRRPVASEQRNEAIEQDSKDPHLLENLSRLGPVTVNRDIQNSLAYSSNMNRILKTQQDSETDANAANTTQNRLLAGSLIELLDERKAVRSQLELDQLASKYNIDSSILESLARFVNSPTPDDSKSR